MLRFMEGFGQFRDIPVDELPPLLGTAGYSSTGYLALAEARDNTQRCLQIGDGSDVISRLQRNFISTAGRVVVGFAYSASARSDIVTVDSVGTVAWSSETGHLSINGASGTAVVLVGLWYYIEIVVDKTNGVVEVWVNNGKDVETALPSSAQFLTAYNVSWSGSNDKKLLDDIVFVDSAAGAYTDRVGPVAILTRLPTADVDKDWSPSTGSEHFPLVDNQPPKEGEYVQSNVSGAYDTYLSSQGIPAGSQMIAVSVTAFARKSDVDNRQLGMVVGKKGQTTAEVVDTDLSTTAKYSYAVFETAPGGSSWNSENVTTTPFGVVVRP